MPSKEIILAYNYEVSWKKKKVVCPPSVLIRNTMTSNASVRLRSVQGTWNTQIKGGRDEKSDEKGRK